MTAETDQNVVVPFRGRSSDQRNHLNEERRTESPEERRRKSNNRLRAAIDARIANPNKRMIEGVQERIRLANNLWRILGELPAGVSKADVLYKAGQGKKENGDSTKRLGKFALDPDLSPAEQQKRGEKLTKTISKYTEILRALSELTGKDYTDLLAQLVHGTSYYPLETEIDATNIELSVEAWTDIRNQIDNAIDRISNRNGLTLFFKRVKELGIVSKWNQSTSLDDTMSPNIVWNDDLPLHPSIHLGEIRVCEDIPCTLFPWMSEPINDCGRNLYNRLLTTGVISANFDQARKGDPSNPRVKGLATPVLSVSIEILPLGKENIITPVIRLEAWTHVCFDEDFDRRLVPVCEMTEPGIFDGIGVYNEPLRDPLNFDLSVIVREVRSGETSLIDFLVEFPEDLGKPYMDSLHPTLEYGTSWISRLDDSSRTLLSKQMFLRRNRRQDGVVSLVMDGFLGHVASLFPSSHDTPLISFPSRSMASLLEIALFYAPPEEGLENILDEQARILTQELEERIENARAHRRKRLDDKI